MHSGKMGFLCWLQANPGNVPALPSRSVVHSDPQGLGWPGRVLTVSSGQEGGLWGGAREAEQECGGAWVRGQELGLVHSGNCFSCAGAAFHLNSCPAPHQCSRLASCLAYGAETGLDWPRRCAIGTYCFWCCYDRGAQRQTPPSSGLPPYLLSKPLVCSISCFLALCLDCVPNTSANFACLMPPYRREPA